MGVFSSPPDFVIICFNVERGNLVETKQLIGVRIKELRNKRGLTQEQLAEMMGINPKYISSIERGKENPTLDIFIKLSETMDVSIGNLFHQLEAEDPEKRLKAIRSLLDQAPADRQRLALKILSALLQ